MATQKQTKAPEVAPEVKPEVAVKAPEVKAEVAPTKTQGPIIEYVGEGAEKIQFKADPKAKLIRVNSNGLIATYF